MGTDQRGIEPAKRARGDGRELGIQVGRGAEDRAGNVFLTQTVLGDQALEHIARGIEDGLARVDLGGGRAANAPAEIGHRILLHTTEEAWSLSLHASEFTRFSLYSTRSNQSFCLAGIKVIKAKEGLLVVRLHLVALFACVMRQTIARNRKSVNRHLCVSGAGDGD